MKKAERDTNTMNSLNATSLEWRRMTGNMRKWKWEVQASMEYKQYRELLQWFSHSILRCQILATLVSIVAPIELLNPHVVHLM